MRPANHISKRRGRLSTIAAIVCCLNITQTAFAGSIVSWGYNNRSQAIPPDGNDFVAIVAGEGHSLALKSDGSILGWGLNNAGQATPAEGNDFIAIAAGYDQSLAIRSNCQYVIAGDLNDDCRVDISDLKILVANWLIDCNLNPANPACVPK